jgi:peptidoglycan/xylan/chitin deacetylase (PgdA/CDA1 family)
VRATRAKQALKNAVYRAVGETVSGFGAVNGAKDRTLRVLMYHKVNDVAGNPVTVPIGVFEEQMAELRELGYPVVGLDAVLAHYMDGAELPPGATLITFDDGYRDILQHALPVLQRHSYPAVLFAPLGFVGEPRPLPHEKRFAAKGIVNRTLDWGELRELEAGGVRIECHGISHRALAELAVDEATREIALAKLRLEERLGREVKAFAYAKGSEAHFGPVHVSLVRQAGYELGFTSVSGPNGPRSDRFRLHRYNVEPYSERTFELVLAGACDLIGLKDTVPGTYARRALNATLGTSSE